MSRPDRLIPAERAARLLLLLLQPMRLSALAVRVELGISQLMLQRYLRALEAGGWQIMRQGAGGKPGRSPESELLIWAIFPGQPGQPS